MLEIPIEGSDSHGSSLTQVTAGRALHQKFGRFAENFSKIMMVVGRGVSETEGDLISAYASACRGTYVHTIEDGEEAKSFSSYGSLIQKMSSLGLSRKDLIAYIGGGTTGDVTGFAAATYMRGITLCAIPSTLLAQIDSAIGGKNGINVSGLKNVAGTFYNPAAVFCDIDFLGGIPGNVMKDSLGEVIKYGVMGDTGILQLMMTNGSQKSPLTRDPENLIARCIMVKKKTVELDPLEKLEARQILNTGHTVAHALEAASSNRISHGRAVFIGLKAESEISAAITGSEDRTSPVLDELALRYGIDTSIPEDVTAESVVSSASGDKKIEGDNILFPVITEPGNVNISRINKSILLKEIDAWCKRTLKKGR